VAPAAATAAPLGANPAIAGFPPVASPPAPWTPVELSLSLVTQPAREQAPPVSLLPALAVRVLLHVSPTARGTANETIAALQAAGAADVVAVPVRFELPRTEVRFFHAADRSAAAGVASVLADGAGGALPRTRDFTNFSPQPAAGGVEVWLAAGQ
jgi:hypothetical protein